MLFIGFKENEKFYLNDNFVTKRVAVIGQSGSGKSYLIGVICEELLRNNLNFCIIDNEGEYYSLKEKFDLILVSNEGDVSFGVDYKELIAKSIKNNLPIILDVSDISNEKEEVNKFLTSLFELESKLREPYLVIIEEVDKYIPQRGKEKEKLEIIKEIAKRGRKRGLGLLIASQRPSFVDKDVLSQCNVAFIGKLFTKNDIQSVSIFFSEREKLKELPKLKTGYFFYIEDKVEKIKVRKRLCKHVSVTPKVKKKIKVSKKVKNVIRELKKELLGINFKFSNFEKFERKKYLFFGEKSKVIEVKKLLVPFYLVKFEVKSFFKKEKCYVVDGVNLIHYKFSNGLKEVCRLKDFIDLSSKEIEFLEKVKDGALLEEVRAKKTLEKLIKKGLVAVIKKKYVVPLSYFKFKESKITLERIEQGNFKIIREKYSKEEVKELFFKFFYQYPSIIKFYYPIAKVKLKNSYIKEIFVDGVSGKKLNFKV